MSAQQEVRPPRRELLRYASILSLIWTLALIACAVFAVRSLTPDNRDRLIERARQSATHQIAMLRWATAQGGIYVSDSGSAHSSDYLSSTPGEGPGTDGQGVRLIDPTQLAVPGGLAEQQQELYSRFISPRALNPDNLPGTPPADSRIPDRDWENFAIVELQSGSPEFISIDGPAGGPLVLHYMAPVLAEESCQVCHAERAWGTGELRGAVSIAAPVQPSGILSPGPQRKLLLAFSQAWAIGILIIGIGTSLMRRRQDERHQAREQLSRSEANLRALFNSSQSGYILIDRQFRVQAFNATAGSWYEELNGIVLESGQMILDNWPKDARGDFVNRVFQALAGKVSNEEQVLAGQAGRSYWFELTFSPVHERDRVLGVCLGLLNITERKLAEAAHRESEERYQHLMGSVSEGISITDIHGSVLITNPAAEKIFGLQPGRFIGRNLREFVSPPDQALLDLERQRRQAGESSTYTLTIYRPDGELRRLQVASSPRLDEQGEYAGAFSLLQDVTETERARQALRESEERYSELVRTAVEGISLTDPQGNFLFANPALEKMLGAEPGGLVGLNIAEFVDPGQHPLMVEQQNRRRAGKSDTYEMRFRARDGKMRDLWVSASPRFDDQGNYAGAFTLAQDVTERKLAQEQTRESEERYRKLVELSPDAIIIQQNGRIVFANAAAEKLLGAQSAAQIIGLPVVRLIHPEFRDAAERRMRMVLDEGVAAPLTEEKLIRLDGKPLDVEVTGLQFSYQHQPAIQLIARDISDRKQAERALRESEERYREFVEGTTDIIIQIDQFGRLSFVNSTASSLGGGNEGQFIGKRAIRFIHPDDRARVQDLLLEAIHNQDQSVTFECRIADQDGGIHDILWTANLHYDQRVWFTGANLIGHDITRQKQMQEQILQRQKEESIVTLAGGIAHDFNNILLGVLGSASLLRMNISEEDPNYELCEVISTSANQMADLTQKLLAYARGGRYQTKAVDMNRLVGDSLTMLRSTIPPQVTVHTELRDNIWPVEGDPGQLNQVLLNLCINACEAMGEKGGNLTLKTFNQHLAETFHAPSRMDIPPGDYVHAIVTDTGHGIPEQTLRRIFEPFFSTKFQGRGLGLAASVGIVANHGGCLWAESVVGQGTRFHVMLPRSARELTQAENDLPRFISGRETILVVDDEDIVRNTARVMLERNGYKVLLAADGPEGLDVYRRNQARIDLVIMDIQMPRMSGAEMYARLFEFDPEARVIVSSGYDEAFFNSGPGTAQLGGYSLSDLPTENFLQKPYRANELVAKVREVLDRERRPAGAEAQPAGG
ncbi:PAS domain S-box protein [bacterium]|nr:PAS domain S-box protein [bacterium]